MSLCWISHITKMTESILASIKLVLIKYHDDLAILAWLWCISDKILMTIANCHCSVLTLSSMHSQLATSTIFMLSLMTMMLVTILHMLMVILVLTCS